ncbi:MAG: NifU N-terminal domain-containing protein [Anaerolineae bacterium]|nr:NifU N-terminal domain-containing protein [Phycisphaerae bacterium]
MAASTGFRVTETQPTPNPNALKFVLDRAISENPVSFFTAASANGHPLATRLFAIPGVTTLLLLNDFVTVNKSPEKAWGEITPQVKKVLASG